MPIALRCLVLFFLLITPCSYSQTIDDTSFANKRVLLLYSYHPTFPSSSKTLAGLKEGFGQNQPIIDIEYMDSKRHSSEESRTNFLIYLRDKLAERLPYDVIIISDDNALQFVLHHRDQLFPFTPVIFLGVNNIELARNLERVPWITGIVEAASFAETIKMSKLLFPTRSDINIIYDNKVSSLENMASIRSLYPLFPNLNFHEVSLNDIGWSELSSSLQELDSKDTLLLVSAYQDKFNKAKSFDEGINFITDNGNVPVFHPWEHGLGDGILGGVTISFIEQGKRAAQQAQKIFREVPVSAIPIITKSPNIPTFDYKQLVQWGVPLNSLPNNSHVLFKPASLWSTYKSEFITVISIISILILCTFYLIQKNQKMRQLSKELLEKSSFLRLLMDTLPDLIWFKGPNGTYLTCNKQFELFAGTTEKDILGKYDHNIFSEDLANSFRKKDRLALNKGSYFSVEETLHFAFNNQQETLETIRTPVYSNTKELIGILGVGRNITERKATEKKIHYLAYHDVLTGLPNRRALGEHLSHAIHHAEQNSASFTVMYLDIDNFKNINDSFGHPEGDRLLKAISLCLSDSFCANSTIARIGGDEFILVFDNIDNAKEASLAAQKILSMLDSPIPLKHHNANVRVSIGVCLYPQDGLSVNDLLRNADSAMYRAKNSGKNTYHFYTQELTTSIQEHLKLEGDLRHAIKKQQLTLHYQPQRNLSTGELVGLEALIRWAHPEHGLVSPDKFIPIAEESDLILTIGEWVLNTAIIQAKQWLNLGIEFGKVAVNLSAKQLNQGNLDTMVQKVLTQNKLPVHRLALEITETCLMAEGEAIQSTLSRLKNMGVELAIDDFGTGYSSLSYLKNLPIHKLKVDRSFIQGIPIDKDDMVICKTVLALGESLGLKVIAEGVETKEQAAFLTQVGCHEVQGYLYSKPITASEFKSLYQKSDKGRESLLEDIS